MPKLLIAILVMSIGTAHADPAASACEKSKQKIVTNCNNALADCDKVSRLQEKLIGDILEVSPGFLNRITDNAATKIVLRINDPDSAEFFSRCFGTKQIQKTTQRITNAKDLDSAEIVGEGTTRDAHQFRASPDLLKTLPTGMGAVLIAHGKDTPHGASRVFKVKFPHLNQIDRMY